MDVKDPINFRGEDILAAVELLSSVVANGMKINPVFAEKLYADTDLDRTRGENKHAVLRKNIYFLARHTKNPLGLVVQFTQRGLFTLDEKDDILDEEQELCCAVAFYSSLIKKDAKIYARALEIFRAFENAHIAEFLESKVAIVNDVRLEPVLRRSPVRPPPPPARLFPAWVCVHCTFENPIGTDSICQVCFKTKGSPGLEETVVNRLELLEEVRPCSVCTLNNSIDLELCNACGSPMVDDVFQTAVPVVGEEFD